MTRDKKKDKKEEQNREAGPEEQKETQEREEEPSVKDKLTAADITGDELWEYCQQAFCGECVLLKQCQEQQLRTVAEAENRQKRLEREKEEFCRYASSRIIEELLPVVDNLELALEHAGDDEACRGLREGVEMTKNIFLETLKKHGLTPVGESGEEFDPNIHEAMAQQETEDMEEGLVWQMLQRGYKLNDRLLRPAKVIVSKKSNKD
ncbi:MAG: nucleotide exchange factor GrpE [Desulfonatronovibrionaceae bacterium]